MQIYLISTFPEYFASVLETSIIKRAIEKGAVTVEVVDPRNFTEDSHRTTDDRPFGGGAGMVMKVEPIDRAIQSIPAVEGKSHSVLTSAKGSEFSQQKAQDWAGMARLIIVCGHYQGVDERVAEHLVDEEVRVGNYVLTGGEPAAAVMIDAVIRLIPEVLGNSESLGDETHDKTGLGAAPLYTRPEDYKGWKVPSILLGGNHAEIEAWRQAQRKPIQE